MSSDRPDPAAEPQLPPSPLWISRRTAGRIMVGVAVVGFVLAIVGTAVAWQLVGQLGRSTDRSLALGQEALISVDATLDLADGVIEAVDGGLGSVSSTLGAVAGTVDGSFAVASATADLARDLGPSLERVDDALGSLEAVTGTVDTVLRQLSQIPFGPSYDPETPFNEAISDVRRDLAPIAASLEAAADDLDQFVNGSDDLAGELLGLQAEVDALRASLAGSGALIEDYRRTSAQAALLAASTRSELDDDLTRSRIFIVVLGLTVAVGQIVPAWVGRTLLSGPGPVA